METFYDAIKKWTDDMDDKDFFQQATIRICSSLNIQTAMGNCYDYLKNFMPLDGLVLLRLEKKTGVIELIGNVTENDLPELTERTYPYKIPKEFEKEIEYLNAGIVKIYNNPELFAENRFFLKISTNPETSFMLMSLSIEGDYTGTFMVFADGRERYTEDHSRLLLLLLQPVSIATSNALKHQELIKLKNNLYDDSIFMSRELIKISGDEVIGAEKGLKSVMKKVKQVSDMGTTVLLVGETGVGKEVIANTIHSNSFRKDGPFVKVNCGAIPETLVDSELFGHEKGAFTGAVSRKRGRFERADGGTILLDEIGELSASAQIRLLRVLQQKTLERVGGTKSINIDVRVIAATHRDLDEMVKKGQFRQDLFYRLNIFPIPIPPLRERKKDIPDLLNHFVSRKSRELKLYNIPEIADGAIDHLMNYDWPGNVRELENIVERALIQKSKGTISFDQIIPFNDINDVSSNLHPDEEVLALDNLISMHIKKILTISKGKINGPGGAAEILGINPNTLRNRMQKLGITYKRSESIKKRF